MDPLDFGKKTSLSITDESGVRSTITLDKFVADSLHAEVDNPHAWLQAQYDRVTREAPQLSRREKGNVVRERALTWAKSTSTYKSLQQQILDSL